MKKNILYIGISLFMCVIIYACVTQQARRGYHDLNTLLHDTQNIQTKPFLKAHIKNGDLFIFNETWQYDSTSDRISGKGIWLDYNRKLITKGDLLLNPDSVLLYETNARLKNPERNRIGALTILAGVDVALGLFCLSNPKACFGSCPTFYFNPEQNIHASDAEGFSDAILPSLEYTDIDAVGRKHWKSGQVSLTMKNEALETHCVKDVALLTFKLKENEQVYHTSSDEFYTSDKVYTPNHVSAPEGNVVPLLSHADHKERFSLADSQNMSQKEELILTFSPAQKIEQSGLLLHFRQTLMTTYFIYNAMGYMGDEVSDILAHAEKNKNLGKKIDNGIYKELGGIEVYISQENQTSWQYQGTFHETGPIAINQQLLLFKNYIASEHGTKVKIRMTKGLWRLDYAALVSIKNKVKPEILHPVNLYYKGQENTQRLANWKEKNNYILSMPGDEYRFVFNIPESGYYACFIQSEGYYIEWMRESWLREKNKTKLRNLLYNPAAYLKSETPAYKIYEQTMEFVFWNSRIDTKNFTSHE